MSDDLWLKELARVNRDKEAEERSRLDECWDRLSAGELPPEEEAELRDLAETSGEARDAWEAFRPLGPDFQASVVQAIRKQGLAPPSGPAVEQPPVKLLPFRRRNALWIGWSAAAAVAAALLLMVRGPVSQPPLPVYTAELSPGDQSFRGGTEPAAGVPVFTPGSTLTLEVTPAQTVTGPVEAYALLDHGGEIVPWEPEPPFEVANGAVRLRGTLGREIQLPTGKSRVWIVVGRPGKIPSARDLQAELRAGRTRHEDWQAVFEELRVEDQASP